MMEIILKNLNFVPKDGNKYSIGCIDIGQESNGVEELETWPKMFTKCNLINYNHKSSSPNKVN